MRPVKVGDCVWIANPNPYSRVKGWPREILTQEEADAVNAAIADGRDPYLPDISVRRRKRNGSNG